jgi:DNA-directed RNA polymerase subunit beta
MDVSPKQIVSVATALIPFLEHDDANRALMGSNMQRQAVPLLEPEAPIVGTGMEAGRARLGPGARRESPAARSSASPPSGSRSSDDEGDERDEYRSRSSCARTRAPASTSARSSTSATASRPASPRRRSSTDDGGELALGQNILVAFLPGRAATTRTPSSSASGSCATTCSPSIHIEKHEIEARDTKLGPEEITRDIPNVGEESLKDLDEDGIIYIGAEVKPGDILVGKITPKGETELTAEERLLRAIFGEKAREVKDSSLRLPHGERGKVVDVREFSRDSGDELLPGVNRLVRVSVARSARSRRRQDGRPSRQQGRDRQDPAQEDMPFLPDGTPVDIMLNPLGVPSRMNIGQILETHLGWAMSRPSA